MKLAIEALRALDPVLRDAGMDEAIVRDLEQARANLQLAYAERGVRADRSRPARPVDSPVDDHVPGLRGRERSRTPASARTAAGRSPATRASVMRSASSSRSSSPTSSGSTPLGEGLDPEDLQDVLGAYAAAMREEIEAKAAPSRSSSATPSWPSSACPVAHEDDPSRALRAALRMRRRLAR